MDADFERKQMPFFSRNEKIFYGILKALHQEIADLRAELSGRTEAAT